MIGSLWRGAWLTLLPAILASAPANAELKYHPLPMTGLRLAVNDGGQLATTTGLATDASASETDDPAEKSPRTPFQWRTTPPAEPDYPGVARDTAYFMLYQTVIIAWLYVLPESISNWTDEDKETYSFEKWKENVRNPHWDEDTFLVNYILHPYWGATYYVRGRERGLSRTQSFFFSAGLSFLFEFGFEALFEQPSYQDLLITPIVGSLIGEYWFWGVRERIKAKPGELGWQDKTVLFLTDPLGVAGALTDRLLGIETDLSVDTLDTSAQPEAAGNGIGADRITPSMPALSTPPAIGLKWQARW